MKRLTQGAVGNARHGVKQRELVRDEEDEEGVQRTAQGRQHRFPGGGRWGRGRVAVDLGVGGGRVSGSGRQRPGGSHLRRSDHGGGRWEAG